MDYFKEILKNFVEARAAEAVAKEAARAAKAAKKSTPKKSKAIVDADGDVDMEDATGDPDNEELDVAGSEKPAKPTKSKKRKPEDDAEVDQPHKLFYFNANINPDSTTNRIGQEAKDHN